MKFEDKCRKILEGKNEYEFDKIVSIFKSSKYKPVRIEDDGEDFAIHIKNTQDGEKGQTLIELNYNNGKYEVSSTFVDDEEQLEDDGHFDGSFKNINDLIKYFKKQIKTL